MEERLPVGWRAELGDELDLPWLGELERFVEGERRQGAVYPPPGEVYSALRLTPPGRVKVVILGQDPYHGPGQAQGLAFSVRPGVRPPPSLRNIFRELADDLGCAPPLNGDLTPWAKQGVLLLNAVLTVRAGAPNSHAGGGWERLSDAVIRALGRRRERVVFILWGAPAARKEALIDTGRHRVVKSAHPSPLSARRGFLGSRPFSRANRLLEEAGTAPVEWCLPAAEEKDGGPRER
jgi:uracil-DNA glycosylase